MPELRDGDARAARLEAVAQLARELAGSGAKAGLDAFLARYYAGVPDEDLDAREPGYLAAAAHAHWWLGLSRPPGTSVVRVFTPNAAADGFESTHTLVQIVNDDMPFLVDSVTMELARQGFGIHLVVHPIARVRRRAGGRLLGVDDFGEDGDVALESFLHVEIDRETDPGVLDALRVDLLRVLADVRLATGDWLKMLSTLRHVVDDLAAHPPLVDPDDASEGRALLEWMGDRHFTFLGYREYDLRAQPDGPDELVPVPGTALGILRKAADGPSRSFAALPTESRKHARDRELLVVTKSSSRSTVHRPTYLDYVGVRKFDARGEAVGEHRFVGLFTSGAYTSSPIDVPVLRRKVAAVLDRAGFLPASHDQKDLVAILESYPRDDLFWIDVDTLHQTAIGILQLQERRRVRLFVNREAFGRFVSCLVFLPRDRYTTPVRERIAVLLTDAFGARSHEWNTRLSESVLARLHYVLHVDPTDPRGIDVPALETQIARVSRAWTDDLRDELVAALGEEPGLDLFREWIDAFPAAYRDDIDARAAVGDVVRLAALSDEEPLSVSLTGDGPVLDFEVCGVGAQPSLSDVLPRLTNLGVVVHDEHPYDVRPRRSGPRWVKRFRLGVPDGVVVERPAARAFEDAFLAVVRGDAEDDGLNRLVLTAGLGWREVALLRAYIRYLRQLGSVYSRQYVEDTLAAHPDLARRLVELFTARFDPRGPAPAARADDLAAAYEAALDTVESLDHDRILRSLLGLVLATLRTNWFRTGADGRPPDTVVFKLDPARIPDMPLPRPMFEIFVCSPRVEGVHLRAGRVARGGIRWSDRREDYRTEVLGLMKAQRVKNVVIVPGGAKGGFVVKQPPAGRDDLAAAVEGCYREFVSGLLDVTDDLVDGEIAPPPGVVRHDGDDPYLVVAADKGTATFSDVANEIACARGFWLGDAFASGGSAGYDHKKMGITARGAWESVDRHFRELGIDGQRTDFTVVGIGDMSGDVFGNGMLCSRHIRLVAAFDHRHVFLDPDPDPTVSFEERARLCAVPGSSWDDYDRSRISSGGGVHPRSAKAIPVTPEAARRLAIPGGITSLTPDAMIRHILCAPVDLLWNGGVGTYVKARRETHTDVGDKTNDAVRVDGADLRCRVVAEGGNLGLTQAGRVEYALAGGLVNTDAIDNSAGVDTSDHEVNIKILLDRAARAGATGLAGGGRDALLQEMTDEVAALVLRDNYRQNRALANARAPAPEMAEVHGRFVRALERSGHLDRAVEQLPDDEALAERSHAGIGLTVPELAVLLAYAKVALEEELLASPVPDDPDFEPVLLGYFPSPLRERFAATIRAHPLRREIVATALANGVVNRAGSTFVFRLTEETGACATDIVHAHEAARAIFDQPGLWHAVERLDHQVGAAAQTAMYLESRRLVERASRWLLRHRPRPVPVAAAVGDLAGAVARYAEQLPGMLRGRDRERFEATTATYAAQGVPHELAVRVAALDPLYSALDVADLAEQTGRSVPEVGALHCVVNDELGFEWLRDGILALPRGDRWQALARGALRDDAEAEHRAVTATILTSVAPGTDPHEALAVWAQASQPDVARALALLDDIRTHGVRDLTTLSVALREIRGLA